MRLRLKICGWTAGAALLATVSCGSSAPPEEADPESESPRAPVSAPEPVQTARVRIGAIQSSIMATGSIIARRTTPIGPAVAGRLLHVFVDIGDQVVFGAPLFQIDPGPYAIRIQEAEAGLALAHAQATEARSEARRTRKLARQNMVSSQEHTHAKTRAAVAEAQVKQAEARVHSVTLDMRRTLVLAPYAGSIVEREAHEGTMATVRPNTRVVVLQESGALEAALDVPEASPVVAQPGDRVRIHLEGVPEPIESRIRAVSDRIDWASRTYQIRVPVADPEGRIKAGAFARAEIEPDPRERALLVERSAVSRQEGRTYLMRVSGGTAERVPVRVGIVGREDVEILSGVAAGDEIVVGEAVSRLGDGTSVVSIGGAQHVEGPPVVPIGEAQHVEGPPVVPIGEAQHAEGPPVVSAGEPASDEAAP
jgi:RND family efflux transporter MFP subunit